MLVVRSVVMVKSKLEDRGIICMFLGYTQNHTGGIYLMLNIRTKCIVLIHDVIWINKTYGEYIS